MMQNADEAKEIQNIFSLFGSHSVNICISYHATDDANSHFVAIYSGSIISIDGVVYFLTAGHVIQQMIDLYKSTSLSILSVAIMDTIGSRQFGDHPIPFVIAGAHYKLIDDEEEGLDVGAIRIDPYYVRLMQLNKIKPIEIDSIFKGEITEIDALVMLGSPVKYVSNQIRSDGSFSFEPTIISIPKDAPFDGHIEIDEKRRLTAITGAYAEIETLCGMSGGPIFGIKRIDGQFKYWLVAIQSSELKRHSRIYSTTAITAILSLFHSGDNARDRWKAFPEAELPPD